MRQILAVLTHMTPSRSLAGGIFAASLTLFAIGLGPQAASAQSVAEAGRAPVPTPQFADEPLIVVELFTSQGCSSCPPADQMMGELATHDGVLPLSLHVDYWDYIGWRDAFAQPEFTRRQKAYAHAAGKRTIYTPQMVVQGIDHLVGAKPMLLADLILRHRENAGAPVSLSLRREGEALSIEAIPTGVLPSAMRLLVVRYDPHERVEIDRGENAGRVIDYTNIVTELRPVGDWNGVAPLVVSDVSLPGPAHTAVILQTVTPRGPGAILAAQRAD
ncbi:DUF1223 domain-containing protein [Celeribacter neptunius]|uniref:DUF1223 domain-containing protein n=1 Tax=Celeribacter neptunius TaxID=588602 RepID=A0A1I3JUM5_9RHOB|nr:DUF1223 domain-containing protein [Celeribacter neptunius]SFI63961.1 hypothetical protein SAMN04487991_0472 [Celeribacter neptunius]